MIYVVFINIILLCIVINFNLLDFVNKIRTALMDRFFRGRITDTELWEKSVRTICIKWIQRTPTLSKSDSAHITLLQVINKKNKQSSIQTWQVGSLYLALKEFGQNSKDADIQLLLSETIQHENSKITSIHDSDYGLLAFATMDEDDDMAHKMLEYIKRATDARQVIRYKENIDSVYFVDTLGFICPFLVKASYRYSNSGYLLLAKQQLLYYISHATENSYGLPFHAYRAEDQVPGGICEWGRGFAWLLIALMESYRIIKFNGEDDTYIRETIVKYADVAVKLQHENGSFSWRLISDGDKDSSVTAVMGWYLACCASFFKNEKYLLSAQKCRDYLMQVTNSNGVIDYCQGDTLSVGVYSRKFEKMPFAQGYALRMSGEIKNAEKNIFRI